MAEEKPAYQEILEFVAKNLVTRPEDVQVERKVDEMGVLLTLRVNQADMGLIIGRQGSTIRALRQLVRVVGLRHRARVNLRVEPSGTSSQGQGEISL